MIKPKVKFIGAKTFTNRLNKYVNTIQKDLNDMAKYESDVLFSRSQRDVPVLTGELKSTGRVREKESYASLNTIASPIKTNVKSYEVTYGGESRTSNGYYASYIEFGVGDGMKLTGEYGSQDVIDFASKFKNRKTKKKVNTQARKYLLRNAFMSKRNLERKVNTLAKNL